MAELTKQMFTRVYIKPHENNTGLDSALKLMIGHPDIPALKAILVLEERKDFIMVCQEQEYLDYVMERTIL